MAVVVPHTHWDREWYAPFETVRFLLVRFLDELIDSLEREQDLVFLLDGQSVMLEDYLEIRRDQAERVSALVRAGRLRPGPCYVQPDEFHVSGEALVRNLLIGCRVAQDFGWVVREGYLPDTFGHVHQLPQILRGFSIDTFYAMRGFGADVDATGAEFWWEAPDGSRVLVNWLSESYSNAAVLTGDADQMPLHHGALVHYDTLRELLDQLSARSPSGVLLLLNGGDHLSVQAGVPDMVTALDRAVGTQAQLRLGGLEEFHALLGERPQPDAVIRGELRYGWRHDVFDGIGSTRAPMKAVNERTEALVSGAAERLAVLASLGGGGGGIDAVRHLWRELVKNYAHDSICGCSVDVVHDEMQTRFAKIGQLATAVIEYAGAHVADATAPPASEGEIPIVVVNPSAFARSGRVEANVVADLDVPLGERLFGWVQAPGIDWPDYHLVDRNRQPVAFTVDPPDGVTVVDALHRRKEVFTDRVRFFARDVPPLSTAQYRLVRGAGELAEHRPVPAAGRRTLTSDVLSAELEADGTLTLTNQATGFVMRGLLELLDDGDAGDEYSFGPLSHDTTYSSREVAWTLEQDPAAPGLVAQATLVIPAGLTADRRARATHIVELPVIFRLDVDEASGRLDIAVIVDNRARDHRLRLRFPMGYRTSESIAESAFGAVRHSTRPTDSEGWRDRPSGVHALRRFVAVEGPEGGLQVMTEGLHEYALDDEGRLDITLLRSVGWLSRMDHPLRSHKIGPELRTPGAQCLGTHTLRLAMRPFGPDEGLGTLYRQAEQFSVPLRAWAVQGKRSPTPAAVDGTVLGLELSPEAIVLSALKTAEDGDGLVLRVFNSTDDPCTAVVRTARKVTAAWRCDLEERHPQPLQPESDASLVIPLRGAEIATVRLHVADGSKT